MLSGKGGGLVRWSTVTTSRCSGSEGVNIQTLREGSVLRDGDG